MTIAQVGPHTHAAYPADYHCTDNVYRRRVFVSFELPILAATLRHSALRARSVNFVTAR